MLLLLCVILRNGPSAMCFFSGYCWFEASNHGSSTYKFGIHIIFPTSGYGHRLETCLLYMRFCVPIAKPFADEHEPTTCGQCSKVLQCCCGVAILSHDSETVDQMVMTLKQVRFWGMLVCHTLHQISHLHWCRESRLANHEPLKWKF